MVMSFNPTRFSVCLRIASLIALAAFAASCGGGSSTSSGGSSASAAVSTAPPSGNWQIALTPSTGTNTESLAGFLLDDSDGAVNGSFVVVDSPCTDVGSVSGTVSGSNISLQVAPVGLQLEMSGTMGSGNSTMSGTYTILSDGCSAKHSSPQTGTWTGTMVTPINGSVNGTLNSTTLANNFTLQGQLAQGTNSGSSIASLTGSLSVSTAGYCFSEGLTVNGSVSGTAVVMNLSDSTGAQQGQITGTISTDGTTFSGKYNIMKQPEKPCKSGDHGVITFTL